MTFADLWAKAGPPVHSAAVGTHQRCVWVRSDSRCSVPCRWANLLPAGIQVCPVEIPGRGRLSAQEPLPDIATLAEQLALGLPLQVSILCFWQWAEIISIMH